MVCKLITSLMRLFFTYGINGVCVCDVTGYKLPVTTGLFGRGCTGVAPGLHCTSLFSATPMQRQCRIYTYNWSGTSPFRHVTQALLHQLVHFTRQYLYNVL